MKKKKKYDKDEALAKIKVLINNHYESLGREMIEDVNLAKQELVEDIDDILNETDISNKHLILEKLQADEEVQELWKRKELNSRGDI